MSTLDLATNIERCTIYKVPKVVAKVWQSLPVGSTVATRSRSGKNVELLAKPILPVGEATPVLDEIPSKSYEVPRNEAGLWVVKRTFCDDAESEDDERFGVVGQVEKVVTIAPKVTEAYTLTLRQKTKQEVVPELATRLHEPPRNNLLRKDWDLREEIPFRYYVPPHLREAAEATTQKDGRPAAPVSADRVLGTRKMESGELKQTIFRIFAETEKEGLSLTYIAKRCGQSARAVEGVIDGIAVCREAGSRRKYFLREEFVAPLGTGDFGTHKRLRLA